MGGIPVLNDNQMNALRRVIGTNQKFDLTVAPQGKSRRLPSYPEEETAASTEGMFRVTENGDGTVAVGGGTVLTSFNYGFLTIEGTTLQRPVVENQLQYVVLNALYTGGGWQLSFSIESGDINRGYIPGENICWHLARLSGGSRYPFVQLWQGGMIDFSSRYYIS